MKAKILDYILIFLLAFLIISFFQEKPEEKQIIKKSNVIVNTVDSSYTVPAAIKLNIENNTDKILKINTCDDISISYNSQPKKINDKSFCKDLVIKANSKEIVSYVKNYNIFEKA